MRVLKLETCGSIDYDLYEEEITSPAVHPPVSSFRLENRQGYPEPISIGTSGGSPDVAVTVQDALRAIHEDLRKLLHRQAWNRLKNYERAAIIASFKERRKSLEKVYVGLTCCAVAIGFRFRRNSRPTAIYHFLQPSHSSCSKSSRELTEFSDLFSLSAHLIQVPSGMTWMSQKSRALPGVPQA
jgi:hypothetical protein